MDVPADVATRPAWISWLVLAIGVGAVSGSAILIRYADTADALAISFWRSAAGALVLAPFARFKRRNATAADVRLSVIAGVFLAVHFGTWIKSVELTSVASSVLLVSTTPIFVALVAFFLFKEKLARAGWLGIVLAVAGAGVIGAAGGTQEGQSLGGDALALIGGITAAGYMLAGSRARANLGIIEYSVVTYTVSAALLLPVCLSSGAALSGYSAQTWWALAGIVVGPQLLGHTLINFVLSDIDATTVSVMIMFEPVLATVLAWLLFSEIPSALIYPGGVAIVFGIYLVTAARQKAPQVIE